MAKATKIPKIPKGLTDKDMMANFVETETLEDKFIAAEKIAENRKKANAAIEPPVQLAKAGFTPALADELGRAILQLKMELKLGGASSVTFKIKRDGENIVLVPKYSK